MSIHANLYQLLPNEVLFRIYEFLQVSDTWIARKVCKYAWEIFKTSEKITDRSTQIQNYCSLILRIEKKFPEAERLRVSVAKSFIIYRYIKPLPKDCANFEKEIYDLIDPTVTVHSNELNEIVKNALSVFLHYDRIDKAVALTKTSVSTFERFRVYKYILKRLIAALKFDEALALIKKENRETVKILCLAYLTKKVFRLHRETAEKIIPTLKDYIVQKQQLQEEILYYYANACLELQDSEAVTLIISKLKDVHLKTILTIKLLDFRSDQMGESYDLDKLLQLETVLVKLRDFDRSAHDGVRCFFKKIIKVLGFEKGLSCMKSFKNLNFSHFGNIIILAIDTVEQAHIVRKMIFNSQEIEKVDKVTWLSRLAQKCDVFRDRQFDSVAIQCIEMMKTIIQQLKEPLVGSPINIVLSNIRLIEVNYSISKDKNALIAEIETQMQEIRLIESVDYKIKIIFKLIERLMAIDCHEMVHNLLEEATQLIEAFNFKNDCHFANGYFGDDRVDLMFQSLSLIKKMIKHASRV